ncbi:MAG: hypothetical protein R3C18_07780 [Planctomycetaceae bacterium]
MTEGPTTKPVDIRLLQQCIDGELSEQAEVDFLSSLDQQSEHWRGLALGFIEDRLLRRACQSFPFEMSAPEPPQAVVAARKPSRREKGSWLPFVATLSLSLCLGVAIGLTWVTWHRSSGSGLVNEGAIAEVEPSNTTEPSLIGRPSQGMNLQVGNGGVRTVKDVPTTSLASEPLTVDPDYELGLWNDNDESVVLPVYSYPNARPEMYERKSVIPQDVEAELRQRGYSVNHRRRYMVIDLEDGRRIVVPQDAVSVEYDVQ